MENTGRGSEGNRYEHRPVLLNEAVDALVWRTDGFYIDGTFGRGGHSRAILARLAPGGRLLAFDKDPEACAAAQLITDARFEIVHGDCAALREQLNQRNAPRVSGVLLDLGLSSPQLDNPARGFSLAPTARWICAWIRGREKARRSGSRAHHNRKWLRVYEDMEKSGLLGRLQRRLQLAGCNRIDMGRSRAHANWLNSWRVQSKPARWGAIPRPAPFRLYGFTSIKSFRR